MVEFLPGFFKLVKSLSNHVGKPGRQWAQAILGITQIATHSSLSAKVEEATEKTNIVGAKSASAANLLHTHTRERKEAKEEERTEDDGMNEGMKGERANFFAYVGKAPNVASQKDNNFRSNDRDRLLAVSHRPVFSFAVKEHERRNNLFGY